MDRVFVYLRKIMKGGGGGGALSKLSGPLLLEKKKKKNLHRTCPHSAPV